MRVQLTRAGEPVSWRFLAKDGAALPEALVATAPAELEIFPGETYDFEFLLVGPAPLRLEVELQRAAGQRASVSLETDQ